jgi:hypothetical protein
MAWSPPARQRRLWLVEQAGDYATPISHHTRDGTVAWKTKVLVHLPSACPDQAILRLALERLPRLVI